MKTHDTEPSVSPDSSSVGADVSRPAPIHRLASSPPQNPGALQALAL